MIVNGVLSYGLMNVPVAVATAASRKELTFKTLHNVEGCHQPIKQSKNCPLCQADNLTSEELAPGFEFTKKNFVALDPERVAEIKGERSKLIAIKHFVLFEEVDELQVDKSYYLQPHELLAKPYTLLSNAIGDRGLVGIGTQSLWGKQTPAMVWAKEGGALVLSTLFCMEDLVPDAPIVEKMGDVSKAEQDLANEFVAASIRTLDPAKYFKSESRDKMFEYVSSLVSETDFEPIVTEKEPEPTIDIMAALKASVELAWSEP